MKKVFLVLLMLLCLCSCDMPSSDTEQSDEERYTYLVNTLSEYSEFLSKPNYYDLTCEMAQIEDGSYRYYVTLDNPRLSMYDVTIMAIEKGVDYSSTMAACSGVLDSRYNLVPNQSKTDENYVKGIVISGTSTNPSATLYIYVDFYNRDYSKEYTEYISMDVTCEE